VYVYSHDRILEALTVNGEISGMQRFEVIVTALKNTDNPALQVCVCVHACMCVLHFVFVFVHTSVFACRI